VIGRTPPIFNLRMAMYDILVINEMEYMAKDAGCFGLGMSGCGWEEEGAKNVGDHDCTAQDAEP
jgi:hypothetical protein